MSNKEERKAPVLRFKGFTDDWEQRKLGDIATFINGRAYSKNELLHQGKYKVLRVGNFYTNDSWYYSDMELDKKYYANYGDLLYTWSATFGPHIWKGEKVIYHYHIWKIILSDEITKNFTLQLLEHDKNRLLAEKSGSTMIHLTKKDMENKEIVIPSSTNEQDKVGLLLTKLDYLITLQQRKLKELQQVKQTLSQFLLNGNTHTRPTLRLNGFEDIWKENKLKDIAKISMGQSPSSNNYNKKGNGKILIQGNADIDNGGIRPRVWTTEITKLANKNDILLTVRAPVGELAITNREVVIGRGIAAIKGNKFIYNLLVQKNKEHFWDRISSGSTFKSISSNDIKQLKVYIPSEKEETLIASVLETIKNKIDFQNERINVINKLKKYLLTNLFI